MFTSIFRQIALAYHSTQATTQPFLRLRPLPRLLWLSSASLLIGLYTSTALANTPTTLLSCDSTHRPSDIDKRQPLLSASLNALPLVAIGASYSLYNKPIRSLRYAYTPSFRYHYDDYLQFAPLATQLSMSVLGLKGSSTNPKQMLLGNALAYGSMLGLVHLGKQTSGVLRPDGSAYNSFPSGHTAMAFTSATLLHLEYGGRYPWLSALGYASATAVGVGRILNNRHWIGDVVTGAALGYGCAVLGYWLSDKLLGLERNTDFMPQSLIPDGSLSLYLPLRHSPRVLKEKDDTAPITHNTTALGVGLQWRYSSKGYYIQGEFTPTVHQVKHANLSELYRSVAFSAGWGRMLTLWKEHIYLNIGNHIQVDLPLSSSKTNSIHLNQKPSLTPKLILSPLWQLNSRIGVSIDICGGYQIGNRIKSSNKERFNSIILEVGSSIWLTV